MKTARTDDMLVRLVGSLADCLTPESARRVLAFKADLKLQTRVDYLAERSNNGVLSPEEHAEYTTYINFGAFVAILKARARQMLADSDDE